MRENVLRDLASRAATDPTFLRQARQDLQGTLALHGYHLTGEEARLVEGLRQQTASMTDEELAHTLASGLEGRTGSPPARPTAPSWRGSGAQDPQEPGISGSRSRIPTCTLRAESPTSYQTAPPASLPKPLAEQRILYLHVAPSHARR